MPAFRFSEAAQQDLREIRKYTKETWGTPQAKAYLLELMTIFAKLARIPKLGRTRDDLGEKLRSFHAGRHLVFYREMSRGIEIARVLHPSMDVSHHIEGEE